MAEMVRNACKRARSDELTVLRLEYSALPSSPKDAAPRDGPIMVERSLPPSNAFSGPTIRMDNYRTVFSFHDFCQVIKEKLNITE